MIVINIWILTLTRTDVFENVENSTQNQVNYMPSSFKNKSKIGIDFTVHQDFECDPFFISI